MTVGTHVEVDTSAIVPCTWPWPGEMPMALTGIDDTGAAYAHFWAAPVPIAHVGRAGNFLAVNERWCHLVGYSESELLRMAFQQITDPLDTGDDEAMVRALLADPSRRHYSMTKRYIHKLGHRVWIDLHVVSVWSDVGQFQHFVSWAIPLPNGGKFKAEQDAKTGEVTVRPMVKVGQFAADNWKTLIPWGIALAVGIYQLVRVLERLMEATGVAW